PGPARLSSLGMRHPELYSTLFELSHGRIFVKVRPLTGRRAVHSRKSAEGSGAGQARTRARGPHPSQKGRYNTYGPQGPDSLEPRALGGRGSAQRGTVLVAAPGDAPSVRGLRARARSGAGLRVRRIRTSGRRP